MTAIVIEADGATLLSNPGPIGGGAAILSISGELLKELAVPYNCVGSNNDAEYKIVISALEWVLSELPEVTEVHIRTDSSLVVNQVAGNWKFRSDKLNDYARQIWAMTWDLDLFTIEWIRRGLNEHADALSKCAVKGTYLPNLLDRDTFGVGPFPYETKEKTYVVRDSRNQS